MTDVEWRNGEQKKNALYQKNVQCHVHEGSRGGGTGLAGPVLAGPRFGDKVMNIQKCYAHIAISLDY